MPEHSVETARAWIREAFVRMERDKGKTVVHPGVRPHLRAAQTQLDAAAALLHKEHHSSSS